MNGKRNELKTSRLVLSTKADPFANMVYKANKPPSLKPVYIKSSPQILKPYKSEEKLTCSREFLPPIPPLTKNSAFLTTKVQTELLFELQTLNSFTKSQNFNHILNLKIKMNYPLAKSKKMCTVSKKNYPNINNIKVIIFSVTLLMFYKIL